MSNAVDSFVVYIVDDDESVRNSLRRLMRASHVEAKVLASAEEFLDAVDADSDGCVLLDLSMPRMSGAEIQARLREKSVRLSLIAVSAHDDEQRREAAIALGAQFFLRKPVDDQALLDTIAWVRAAARTKER